jgi:hypothetical protein
MARAKKSKSKLSELEGQPDPRAALDSAGLLSACRGVLARLEADLLERTKASPAVTRALAARYEAEKAAERTAESFAGWTALLATQVAAAWVLSCVFVRTLEDRGLLKQARLAGPGAEDSQRQFFQLAPSLTERDYLLTVFRELAHHPAARDLFDAKHSPVWKLSPSAAAAKELLALFRLPNATTPAFRFGQASTRFLGDLYQDISEDVRKRYALLQTPDFIESFILDRTLEPAIQRFGLDDTTLIDPTCGSGHFLLGAFDRLFEHRLHAEPGVDPRGAAVKALDCVYGADINPYAVAIARFRLTLSFLEKAGYTKLADAPTLPLHLVVADSLRINAQHPQGELWHQEGVTAQAWLGEVFTLEDDRAAKDVLFRQYAAVVGNPPYITPKDRALRTKYAEMYKTCFMNYALSVPFCERIFQLARPRGYTGQITANSFMKREFGSKLIEDFLPNVNLELIVNTSGAYIPGHGTPTMLLFGTQEPPSGGSVLTVLAKRGEPSTPDVPSQGEVWSSIVKHVDDIGFDNAYISVVKTARATLTLHPWSLGGGGASELKDLLEQRCTVKLSNVVDDIGFSIIVGEDDLFKRPKGRRQWANLPRIPIVVGEEVRDWSLTPEEDLLSPFRGDGFDVDASSPLRRELWPWRTILKNRVVSGSTTMEQANKAWFDVRRLSREKHKTKPSIVFAFVATHNHFVLDRGGKVFKQSAPIIKLPVDATEDEHLALLAFLNSSTACFWMKQVFMNKGGSGIGRGIQDEAWESRFEFDGTKLGSLPVFGSVRLTELGRRMDQLARERLDHGAARVLAEESFESVVELRRKLTDAYDRDERVFHEMVALQEEIDGCVYVAAGLTDEMPAPSSRLVPGTRTFEHQLAVAHPTTQWFERNGYADPRDVKELPPELHERWALLKKNAEIALIEQPDYKRRWTKPDRDIKIERACRDWLASQLEQHAGARVEISTRRYLVEHTLAAPRTQLIARFRSSSPEEALASELAYASVGFVAAARYTEAGLAKHALWCETWEAQREQDRGGNTEAHVPPKFDKGDFVSDFAWSLRGKLDVPKERLISYPGCESDNDGEPVYGWAGWDHLQRAKALGALYLDRKDREGWTADRLTPMLAGLLELIPWVKQWHNEPSEEFGGLRMGDYYEQFLAGECRLHGLTHDDLRAWRPTKKPRGSGKAAAKARAAKAETEDDAAKSGNGEAGEFSEVPAPKKRRAKKRPAAAKEPPVSEEAE